MFITEVNMVLSCGISSIGLDTQVSRWNYIHFSGFIIFCLWLSKVIFWGHVDGIVFDMELSCTIFFLPFPNSLSPLMIHNWYLKLGEFQESIFSNTIYISSWNCRFRSSSVFDLGKKLFPQIPFHLFTCSHSYCFFALI